MGQDDYGPAWEGVERRLKPPCIHCSREKELDEIHKAILGGTSVEEPGLVGHVRKMTGSFAEVVIRVGKLEKAMLGNGTAGFYDRVRALERTVKILVGACTFLGCTIAGVFLKAIFSHITEGG